MSKCPFWSTSKKKVNCYSECPMLDNNEENECLFQEHISVDKIDFKDIIDYDYGYSKEEDFKMNYEEESSTF